MNGLIEAGRFRGELAGWAVRGFLCAVPSAVYAVIGGFQRPNEVVAMVIGFAAYVVLFAGFCSAHAMQLTAARQRLVRTLKMSAWFKVSLLCGAALACPLASIPHFSGKGLLLGVAVAPDLWLGMVATSVAGWLAGVHDVLLIGELNSFPWTLLTTLLQGALISGLLFALAGTFLGCRQLWISLEGKPITPARSAG